MRWNDMWRRQARQTFYIDAKLMIDGNVTQCINLWDMFLRAQMHFAVSRASHSLSRLSLLTERCTKSYRLLKFCGSFSLWHCWAADPNCGSPGISAPIKYYIFITLFQCVVLRTRKFLHFVARAFVSVSASLTGYASLFFSVPVVRCKIISIHLSLALCGHPHMTESIRFQYIGYIRMT